MAGFEKLFGLNADSFRKNCIICPSNDASLFINKSQNRKKGLLFSVDDTGFASVISSKNNFLIGDCVLMLKETSCRNLFLFGSCASAGKLKIGDSVAVDNAVCLESFSSMLDEAANSRSYFPDKGLFGRFYGFAKGKGLSASNCATVSSLYLEKGLTKYFADKRIDCADMESSIVYSAAGYAGLKALSVLYVTDIINKKQFFEPLSVIEKKKLNEARKRLSGLLSDFIKNELA